MEPKSLKMKAGRYQNGTKSIKNGAQEAGMYILDAGTSIFEEKVIPMVPRWHPKWPQGRPVGAQEGGKIDKKNDPKKKQKMIPLFIGPGSDF